MFKTDHLPIIDKGFTSKESYLTWRTAWQAHYAELTKAIRAQKHLRSHTAEAEARSTAQCWCYLLRRDAVALLEKRKWSKLEAQRQYQAAKAEPVPAC